MSFAQRMIVYRVNDPHQPNLIALIFSVESPPSLFRKYDGSKTHLKDSAVWSSRDALYRQVEVHVLPQRELATALPISLKREESIIDIGT